MWKLIVNIWRPTYKTYKLVISVTLKDIIELTSNFRKYEAVPGTEQIRVRITAYNTAYDVSLGCLGMSRVTSRVTWMSWDVYHVKSRIKRTKTEN